MSTVQKYDLKKASEAYGQFLTALGFDWQNDPHMKDTPNRVSKAWVQDLCRGVFTEGPKISTFENDGGYTGVVFQGDIEVVSMCSHHNLAFTGKAYVAYIPQEHGSVIGLSKINRIVEYYARRPQVQETLTSQIHKALEELLPENCGIAVHLQCKHTCCSNRGVGHDSTMKTTLLSGAFKEEDSARNEFFSYIK